MNAFPDSNWLKFFNLKASDGIAFAIIGVIGYTFSRLGWFQLDALGVYGNAAFAALALVGLGLLGKHAYEALERRSSRKKRQAERLRHLDALSATGKRILTYLVSTNQRNFVAPCSCLELEPLISSSLIEVGDGGTLDEQPHFVRDYVWKELQRRRKEFWTDDVACPPWTCVYQR